jgi:hypothetical protein
MAPAIPLRAKHAAKILAWKSDADELAALKAREGQRRAELVEIFFKDAPVGTTTVDLGEGYTLACEKKINFKVDPVKGKAAEAALRKLGEAGQLIADRIFKWKPDLSVREFKALDKKQLAIVSPAVTESPATPSIELREPKAARAA